MARIAGTPKKISIAGIEFTSSADASMKITLPVYKNDAIPTTGDNMRKAVKQPTPIKGLPIIGDANEFALLKTLAESLEDITMSVTMIDGSTYKSLGWIDFQEIDSMENKANVDLYPRRDWTPLLVA